MSKQNRQPNKKLPRARELAIRIVAGILCFLMVFSVLVVAISAYENSATDLRLGEEVDVGLFYADSLAESFTASTEKGFRLEIPSGDGILTFNEASEIKSVSVVSGANLLKEGGTYISAGENTDVHVGGYRVMVSSYSTKVGGSSDNDNIILFRPMATTTIAFDKENIQGYIKRIAATVEKLGSHAFPAYIDGKYYISLGAFESKEDAEAFVESFGKSYVCDYTVTEPDKSAYSVIDYQTNNVIFHFSGIESLMVTPVGNAKFSASNGKDYYGRLLFERTSEDGFEIINTLCMEEYVASRLSSEVDTSWNVEALKAVATVIRTNAYAALGDKSVHSEEGFDFCTDAHCGEYHGCGSVNENAAVAVNSTQNTVIKSDGELINAVFGVNYPGATVSLSEAYGDLLSSDGKYLEGRLTAWENYEKRYSGRWQTEVTPSELYEILSQRVADCKLEGNISEINITKRSENGIYTTEIEFIDIFENKLTLRGSEIIRNLLAGVVKSSSFEVGKAGSEVKETQLKYNAENKETASSEQTVKLDGAHGNFVFVGRGSGSGLGMSLNGVNDIVNNGYSYEDAYIDVIKLYYSGVTVEKLEGSDEI
ncbi:MAG: SpoIID/LytB domain-containing protein [Ruminococcaceae bacterium]|nr:SpoIID/LytB domain-containing protein [Oscillospiraceae bacterium]